MISGSLFTKITKPSHEIIVKKRIKNILADTVQWIAIKILSFRFRSGFIHIQQHDKLWNLTANPILYVFSPKLSLLGGSAGH